ncbi:TIGR03767 family metallophosphoesterase [Streptomyces sp. NBC_01498]|uniref:TIGR03767 family metallophosphoesterase n=1 Tax=Streptomyces sp. NBC_01498 TaxID=2975870 RepID=UPI002E7BF5CF|nr:TIGR03767 family metallophosphoesterase [Streptomyces sp. NBC_01498]WTL28266.1 TIGR03767 family metallophosphoesterase [Streptomyces sp. NBC_01498]
MSRIRSAVTAVDRRSFLAAAGAVGLSAGIGVAVGTGGGSGSAAAAPAPTAPAGPVPTAAPVPAPSSAGPSAPLTTLHSRSVPRDRGAAFRRLGDGPGWRRVVREQFATAKSGREDRRTVLSSFVQLTDLHVTDVQHPVRTEYVRSQSPGAWRPHEALSVAGGVSLIERINSLGTGPATGAPLAFAMTTGDNTDNNALCELDWYLTLMSGGLVTPNTGDPEAYEGVQNSGARMYWHPEDGAPDAYKRLGFPRVEGFLEAALRPVRSPGLALPWYSTVGNHDSLASGAYSDRTGFLADFAVGARKLYDVPKPDAETLLARIAAGESAHGEAVISLLRREKRRMRAVTPDPRRAPFTPLQYLTAHLDPRHTGAGPAGHGYTRANLADGSLDYTFPMGENVTGVSLDTTDHGGHFTGSVGTGQLDWLERVLTEHRDGWVVLFTHHNSWTMGNERPDPARPGEARHDGNAVVSLLRRHRSAVAWINGHSHRNVVLPHGSFWEISTASHIDFPQLARVIEIADNRDGTLSLFTTLIESAAPRPTDFTDLSPTGLASLYRELALNTPGSRQDLAGTDDARNTELLLRR